MVANGRFTLNYYLKQSFNNLFFENSDDVSHVMMEGNETFENMDDGYYTNYQLAVHKCMF